ncbi:MAG: hypothetical protein ACOY3P_00770, partial [Planctomycetota bacterium]
HDPSTATPPPRPRRSFHIVSKAVGSACNLRCRYCYYLHKRPRVGRSHFPRLRRENRDGPRARLPRSPAGSGWQPAPCSIPRALAKTCSIFLGGSGSTLVGAEQTGRKAFLMELDSLYPDVIVDRWENFTGTRAQCEAAVAPVGLAEAVQ